MKLLINQLVERNLTDAPDKTETLRLLWKDEEGYGIAVINVYEPKALPVMLEAVELEAALLERRAKALDEDPFTRQLLEAREAARSIESYFEIRDRAWEMIQPLIEDQTGRIFLPRWRGKMIREVADRNGTSRKAVYGYLRRHWQWGHKDALLPFYFQSGAKGEERKPSTKKRGRPTRQSRVIGVPTGTNIDEDAKIKIVDGLRKYYEKQKGHTFKEAYEEMLDEHFPVVGQQPTIGQARYWYQKERSVLERKRGRVGKKFELRYRDLSGISTDIAPEVGALYQIDATVGDIYLVSSLDRSRIIGRPVIYVVVDVFSRLVVGFYVGLEGPSWLGAALALEHAFLDKMPFLKRYGLMAQQNDWVGPGLPKQLLADRGELLSENANGIIAGLNIFVSNTPPYRPDWKGIVERRFRLINDEVVVWLPGAIRQLPEDRKRGNPDDARLDIHEFRTILAHMFHYYNTQHKIENYPLRGAMLEDQVRPVPQQMWNWGIKHQSGKLHYQPRDIVRASLLPRKEASITRDGIYFDKLLYTSPRERRESWSAIARTSGTWRVPIAYDPRETGWIYVFHDGQMEVAQLKAHHEGYRHRDWYEVKDYQAVVALDDEDLKADEREAKRAMQAKVEEIVDTAAYLTEQDQSLSGKEKGAMKESRMEMREQLRQEESWQPEGVSENPSARDSSADVSSSMTPERIDAILEEEDLSILKKIRDRARKGKESE